MGETRRGSQTQARPKRAGPNLPKPVAVDAHDGEDGAEGDEGADGAEDDGNNEPANEQIRDLVPYSRRNG